MDGLNSDGEIRSFDCFWGLVILRNFPDLGVQQEHCRHFAAKGWDILRGEASKNWIV